MWVSQEIRWGQLRMIMGAPNGTIDEQNHSQFAYKLSAGTLVSLTEKLSLDVNYQYVNLGAFKGGTDFSNGVFQVLRRRH